MRVVSDAPVKTYTIGFSDPRHDEAPHAKAVARHLGTEHTEWYVTEQMALDLVPTLGRSTMNRSRTVHRFPRCWFVSWRGGRLRFCLSGDGGDEIFGGYSRYRMSEYASQLRGWCPGPIRKLPAKALAALANRRLVPKRWLRRLRWAADLLEAQDEVIGYARMMSSGRRPQELVYGSEELPSTFGQLVADPALPLLRRCMLMDLQSYLPDDILVKVDRAAMSVSLETRAPFLNHRVVQFASRLPQNCLTRQGRTKWILRELLERYVPRSLTERPKMGFGVPLAAWMRGALREWCAARLAPVALADGGLFKVESVQRLWNSHVCGEIDASVDLWPLLMFQEWKAASGPELSLSGQPHRTAL